jgi:hypothetical protein
MRARKQFGLPLQYPVALALAFLIMTAHAAATAISDQDRSQSRSEVASTAGIVASESVLASQVGVRA